MSNSFVAHGQNVIVEPIKEKNGTYLGKVLAFGGNRKKIPIGAKVLYCQRDFNELQVGKKECHVIWEPHIRMISLDVDEVEEISDELPDFKK